MTRHVSRDVQMLCLAGVLLVVVFWCAGARTALSYPKRDFANLYVGAILAQRGDYGALYDREQNSALGRELIRNAEVQFVRPAFYAPLLSPLARLDFSRAFGVFVAVNLAVLAVVWLWAWRTAGTPGLLLAAVFPPPMIAVLLAGQDTVLLLAVLTAAFLLARTNHTVTGGLVLALTLCKFHLVLLLPLALFAGRYWRMLGGFALGATAVGMASLGLVGRQGTMAWFQLMTDSGHRSLMTPSPELLLGLDAVASGPVLIAAIVLVVLVVTMIASAGPLWLSLSAAIVGSLVIAPHVFTYDATVLLLPVVLICAAPTTIPTRLAALLVASPLPYLGGPPWGPLSVCLLLVALAGERLSMNRSTMGSGIRPGCGTASPFAPRDSESLATIQRKHQA